MRKNKIWHRHHCKCAYCKLTRAVTQRLRYRMGLDLPYLRYKGKAGFDFVS